MMLKNLRALIDAKFSRIFATHFDWLAHISLRVSEVARRVIRRGRLEPIFYINSSITNAKDSYRFLLFLLVWNAVRTNTTIRRIFFCHSSRTMETSWCSRRGKGKVQNDWTFLKRIKFSIDWHRLIDIV